MRNTLITIIIASLVLAPISAHALSVTPNDPYLSNQKYVPQTSLNQAWGYSIGSPDVVIAVIDSGVDLEHPDLKKNIWINQDEIPDNNIDDDNNGYVDDIYGWNFVENNNDPNPVFKNYSTEGASHGTLIAGIIAASANNSQGIVGVTWQSKIMALRALDSRGEGYTGDAAKAIRYAINAGADVINLSFVGTNDTLEFRNAVKAAYEKNIVVVAAVGNDALGSDSELSGGNLDQSPVYPACFRTTFNDYVIGVGSVNDNNQKSSFSNFGKHCLDINAPGIDIVSTQTRNDQAGPPFTALYSGLWNGTSFAAPQVSGVAALIKSINKNYNNNQIRSLILDTADNIDTINPDLKGKMGYGLLNARRALKAAAPAGFTPQNPIELLNLQRNNAALWISSNIESAAFTNNLLNVNIKFKNKGSLNWNPNQLRIKIVDWNGDLTEFKTDELVYQKSPEVKPSQTAEFSQTIKTPGRSGTYKIKFQLSYKGIDVKGGAVYKTINIATETGAALIQNSVPLAVLEDWGQITPIIKIRNTGQTAWTQTQVRLKLSSPDSNFYIAGNIRPLELTIMPGGVATFKPVLHFRNARKKIIYYQLKIDINNNTINVESGERIVRID